MAEMAVMIADAGWLVFAVFTCLIAGGAAVLAGQAVARGWKPLGLALFYGLLLGLANRFLVFALFDGALLAVPPLAFQTALLMAVSACAWRTTRVQVMVTQYPWLYRRDGIFNWQKC